MYFVLCVLAAVCLFLLFRLITAPIRWIWKVLLNTFFGFLCLLLINLLGCAVGFQIGISAVTATTVGILGLPGALLLLALEWLL